MLRPLAGRAPDTPRAPGVRLHPLGTEPPVRARDGRPVTDPKPAAPAASPRLASTADAVPVRTLPPPRRATVTPAPRARTHPGVANRTGATAATHAHRTAAPGQGGPASVYGAPWGTSAPSWSAQPPPARHVASGPQPSAGTPVGVSSTVGGWPPAEPERWTPGVLLGMEHRTLVALLAVVLCVGLLGAWIGAASARAVGGTAAASAARPIPALPLRDPTPQPARGGPPGAVFTVESAAEAP